MVSSVFASWLETGQWPPLDDVQRNIDRRQLPIDVTQAFEAMPRSPGEQRSFMPSVLSLPIRILRFLPDANGILDICLVLVRRTGELYVSEAATFDVRHDDPALAPYDPLLASRAASLVGSDYPTPFGGTSGGGGDWTLQGYVQNVRRFRGVESLSDYVETQRKILAPREVAESSSPATRRAFVIMPFGSAWSAEIYDEIKLAADGLQSEVDLLVERADEISSPGRITDQIVAAIEQADLVIADITDSNPNVMWELGHAQALGKPPVILNHSNGTPIPFDLHDWRQIICGHVLTNTDRFKLRQYMREALFS